MKSFKSKRFYKNISILRHDGNSEMRLTLAYMTMFQGSQYIGQGPNLCHHLFLRKVPLEYSFSFSLICFCVQWESGVIAEMGDHQELKYLLFGPLKIKFATYYSRAEV